MRYVLNILALVAVLLSLNVVAQPKQSSGKCTNTQDVPGDFVNACALAGGSEVRCSSGTPMCCKKEGAYTHCYDDVNDVKGRRSGAQLPGMPSGGNRLAPPAAPTAPKNPVAPKSPGTLQPK